MQHESVVIGAKGFLGGALVRRLEASRLPVTAYTRDDSFLQPDGRPHPSLLGAQTVYWLASSINPAIAERDPDRVVADQDAFTALLAVLERAPSPPRVILLSSGGTVYDPAESPPYDETAPTRPINAYGRAKLALEDLLRKAEHLAGSGVILRVSNAYGPGQKALSGQGVVAHWLHAVLMGRPIRLIGDPTTKRDYVFVKDVVEALIAAGEHRDQLPPVINAGAGQPTSLSQLLDVVLEVVGEPRPRVELVPRRAFDVAETWLDTRLAADVLAWRPRTPLAEGVAATWSSVSPDVPTFR